MGNNKWIGLLYFIILRQVNTITAFDESEESFSARPEEEKPLVEVRAVFINCGTVTTEGIVAPDSDSMRFQREELFKHNVLRDCNKKLAVTVKISSEADQSSGDEYLPIEHVFEGSDKKRVRLLDPYILHLRREPPFQAYKLRRVDTVSGIMLNTAKTFTGDYKHPKGHIKRDIGHSDKEAWTPNDEVYLPQTNPVTLQGTQSLQSATLTISQAASHSPRSCVENDNMCTNTFNTTLGKRKKRNEHNIVVEKASDDNKKWNSNENYYRISEPVRQSVRHSDIYEETSINDESHHRPAKENHKKITAGMPVTEPQTDKATNSDERNRLKQQLRSRMASSKEKESKAVKVYNPEKIKTNSPSLRTKEHKSHNPATNKRFAETEDDNSAEYEEADRDYAVYEIGRPELWYTVHIQLFEKLSTPDGKTVWNDLTKGEQASVSSKSPEWTGQDMNVRYRPAEWIPREEFSLPTKSLCLLAPIRGANSASYNESNMFSNDMSEDGRYIVLPEEDVMGMKDDDGMIYKRNYNNTESEFSPKLEEHQHQGRRKVVVRSSRALLSGTEENVNIAILGTDKYLTLPHKRPHCAQIDLEARADGNELVRVGASGRIAIAVADSTRRTRTILTLQVGNTGLAAARFRVITQDCGPALSELVNEKNKRSMIAGPVLIPPRHTKSLRLELPVEIPIDVAHCSVSLVNDDEKLIAVRDVAIKKGDRCFCVWHCDCVCLSDDPRLLCHEMEEARQSAAGLSSRDRRRHARSACYKDVIYFNLFVIIAGVLMLLLLLGLLKAILGLLFNCIGSWGLDKLVQLPRKINHYYESDLRRRHPVEYDDAGYPVHPDTKERTVRLYSRSMQFVLNIIFFVCVPCIIVYDAIKDLISRFRTPSTQDGCKPSSKNNTKKCFSTQDLQGMAMRWQRRRGGLRKWMTPQAQDLSRELWNKGLLPSVKCELMRPLLREGHAEPQPPDPRGPDMHESSVDSEQDDTDYVLTQMQMSRESLSILMQKSKT